MLLNVCLTAKLFWCSVFTICWKNKWQFTISCYPTYFWTELLSVSPFWNRNCIPNFLPPCMELLLLYNKQSSRALHAPKAWIVPSWSIALSDYQSRQDISCQLCPRWDLSDTPCSPLFPSSWDKKSGRWIYWMFGQQGFGISAPIVSSRWLTNLRSRNEKSSPSPNRKVHCWWPWRLAWDSSEGSQWETRGSSSVLSTRKSTVSISLKSADVKKELLSWHSWAYGLDLPVMIRG